MQELTAPRAVAGIRNFVWVEPGVLARGEQPPLTDETFSGLRELGITAVLSLRPHDEQPSPSRRLSSPDPYDVDAERSVAERNGLRFAHAPIEDFSAPPPELLAAALETLDRQVADDETVYVHCRAGAGRAGLVTGAWVIARGGTGDDAAERYQAQMDHLGQRVGLSADDWHATLRRIGQPQVLWALREIARALGSPLSRPVGLLPAEKPADADGWEQRYWDSLSPWRAQRSA
jgi:protein tyrosine phosphatase (PTP) superfamily phosphohydrolase (DUF442 family)